MFSLYREEFNWRWLLMSIARFILRLIPSSFKDLVSRLRFQSWIWADVLRFRTKVFHARSLNTINRVMPRPIRNMARRFSKSNKGEIFLFEFFGFFVLWLDQAIHWNFPYQPKDIITLLGISFAVYVLTLIVETLFWRTKWLRDFNLGILLLSGFIVTYFAIGLGIILTGHLFSPMITAVFFVGLPLFWFGIKVFHTRVEIRFSPKPD